MEKKKVTLSLPRQTTEAAQQAARDTHVDFSAFAARALRNETLRQQLAARPLPELTDWLDDAEHDEAGAA